MDPGTGSKSISSYGRFAGPSSSHVCGRMSGGGSSRRGSSDYGTRQCTHCGGTNHIVEYCYDLHGFPQAQPVAISEDAGQFTHSSANRRVTISAEEYQQYQRLLSLQTNSSIATLSQTGSSVACIASSHSSNHWVIDSGASDHMTGTPSILSGRQSLGKPSRVTLADGSTTNVTGLGFVHVTSSLTLDSVLQVPRFPLNLMSVSKLTKSLNCSVTFFPNGCVFQDLKTGRKIGGGVERGGLYYFTDDVHPSSVALQSSMSVYQHHCRFGHPSLENLKRLVPSCSRVNVLPCEVCEFSKHHRVSFYPRVESRASRPFELVHSDIWGPMHVPNIFGFQYYVIFVDDFSRVTYLYLMKKRSELSSIFKSFYMEIKTQFDTCIRIFRSDNAREYFKNTLSQFFEDHGIIHQSSCARTPQQNGVAERKIRHLSEVMRAMLFQMQVPKSYWSDAVLTACYLINRMPSSVLGGQIPHKILFPGRPLHSLPLRIFGCTCYVHALDPDRSKLDPRSIRCIFLGYSRTQKGYKCYSPSLRRLFVC